MKPNKSPLENAKETCTELATKQNRKTCWLY